jgi:hypothetical protein
VAVTIALTISIGITIYLMAPKSSQVSGVPDSDNDGIPDDEDFFNAGNGGVELSVDSFQGSCGNWFGTCRPKFTFRVDVDFDGDYDVSATSPVASGDDLQNPFSTRFDIPDDQSKIRVMLEIVDDDGGDPIDWTNDPESTWGWVEMALTPGPHSWQGTGSVGAHALVEFSGVVVALAP